MRKLPKVAIVTGTEVTRRCLQEQLVSLIGDIVNIEGYALDEGVAGVIEADLILVSSAVITLEEPFRQHVSPDVPRIVAKRMINLAGIDELIMLRSGTVALLVNDVERSAIESIISLQQLGLDHIKYIPYSPKSLSVPDADLAITPGEVEFVPQSVKRVIDIGPRLIDLTTILEILAFFKVPQDININLSEGYMKHMVQLSKKFAQQLESLRSSYHRLEQITNSLPVGVLAAKNSSISYANGRARKLLKLEDHEWRMPDVHSWPCLLAEGQTLADGTQVYAVLGQQEAEALHRSCQESIPDYSRHLLNQIVEQWERNDEKQLFARLLEKVAEYNAAGSTIGRKALAEMSESELGVDVSEQQVRQLLDRLEDWGLVRKKRGRHGTRITDKGHKMLSVLRDCE